MTQRELERRFPHASPAFLKANGFGFGICPDENTTHCNKCGIPLSVAGSHLCANCLPEQTTQKRIRQSSKPVMNKLEQEYFDILSAQYPNYPRPRAQAVRFKLCNGVTFTPDIFCASWPSEFGPVSPATPTAFEVKGKHAWDDAIVKIKMAAHEWLEIRWVLAWKESGEWKTQLILD